MIGLIDNEILKRGLIFLFLNIGIFIFGIVVLTKINMAQKDAETQTQQVSSDVDWQAYLYHKTMLNVLSKETIAQK